MFLAKQQKPTLNTLVQLVELMPNYMFNAYGASIEWIARDRALLRDTVAAMIEANRAIYRDKDKVIPIIVDATKKPKEAVEFAWKIEHQELRVVGQHRLRPQAHAMVDRQQRRRTATSRRRRSRPSSRSSNIKLAEEAVERRRRSGTARSARHRSTVRALARYKETP